MDPCTLVSAGFLFITSFNCAGTEVEGVQQLRGDLFPVAGAPAEVHATLLGAARTAPFGGPPAAEHRGRAGRGEVRGRKSSAGTR